MTFTPQLIDNTPPGETLRSGATKINSNFEAVQDEFDNLTHASLPDIGTNTHSTIDNFIGSKAAASGLASLDTSSLVVQNPANATSTPTASKIPIADGSGKLDGWVSLSSKADAVHTHSYAATDHDSTHITSGSDEIDGDKLDIDWNPVNYIPTIAAGYSNSTDNLTSHLNGIDTKLSGYVHVKGFGAVGDGIVDDTVAVTAAITSGEPLDWGGLTYRITSAIAASITSDIHWVGRGATVIYDGSHTEYAMRLSNSTGDILSISDITINGNKKCNVALYFLNASSMNTATTVVANNVWVCNIKRQNTFSYGYGLLIRGAFNSVTLNGGGAVDCELPEGQGTPFAQGVAGVAAYEYEASRWIRRLTLNGTHIEKVYSSDSTYAYDQDGVLFFSPTESGSGKVESQLVIMGGCQFKNCYGRSIKTQCRNTVVRDSLFYRDEGLSVADTNGEMSIQTGSMVVDSNSFSYHNTQSPGHIVKVSQLSNWKVGASITNNEVFVDSDTVVDMFVSTWNNSVDDSWSTIVVKGNKIIGTINKFIDFGCNSDKNYLTVEDNWVAEIGETLVNGAYERAFIYVRGAGSNTPYHAYVFVMGNVYDGSNTVYLVRDNITGSVMRGTYSAFNNFGFYRDITQRVNVGSPLKNTAISANLTGFENTTSKGFFGVQSKTITSGATETFLFSNSNSLIIICANYNLGAYAFFSAGASTSVISAGGAFNIGTTSDPGSGTFRSWVSGTNTISVKNTDASSRNFTVWVFAP